MNGFDFLKWMRDEKRVPWSREQKPPVGERPSNSELLRWLNNRAVRIDGAVIGRDSEVTFPAEVVTFFTREAITTMPGFGR